MSQNSYLYAFSVVFLAGIFWSFGALTVRYMVDGHQYVFQYLFYFFLQTILGQKVPQNLSAHYQLRHLIFYLASYQKMKKLLD